MDADVANDLWLRFLPIGLMVYFVNKIFLFLFFIFGASHWWKECQCFDDTFRSDEIWNIMIFLLRWNSETWNANEISYIHVSLRFARTKRETQIFFTLDKWNVKQNNSVSLSFRTFDRSTRDVHAFVVLKKPKNVNMLFLRH
jgi:hypothetical protein